MLSRPSHPAQALQVSFSGNEVQLHFAGLAVQRPALVQKNCYQDCVPARGLCNQNSNEILALFRSVTLARLNSLG